MVDIKEEFPPNIDFIRTVLNPPPHTIFAYGNTIYNPSGREITADLIFHESVHARQQGTDPDGWWFAYINDEEFRFDQEREAYALQYDFAKRQGLPTRITDMMLDAMAKALGDGSYGFTLTLGQARSKIRQYEVPSRQEEA